MTTCTASAPRPERSSSISTAIWPPADRLETQAPCGRLRHLPGCPRGSATIRSALCIGAGRGCPSGRGLVRVHAPAADATDRKDLRRPARHRARSAGGRHRGCASSLASAVIARPRHPADGHARARLRRPPCSRSSSPGSVSRCARLRPAAPAVVAEAPATPAATPRGDADGFEALSEEHLQRSKLVVLGLATKDPSQVTSADWDVRTRPGRHAVDRHADVPDGGAKTVAWPDRRCRCGISSWCCSRRPSPTRGDPASLAADSASHSQA